MKASQFLLNFHHHFHTVVKHRRLVRKGCFAVGLYRQGIMHDLSKFSPVEFLVGVRYFQGSRSPNSAEREDVGYSTSWMHHKGRNRHHFEYWTDIDMETRSYGPVEMPDRYLAEMIMDRIAASKTYRKNDYCDSDPLAYYQRAKESRLMHPATAAKLEMILSILAERGEKAAFEYIRKELLKGR